MNGNLFVARASNKQTGAKRIEKLKLAKSPRFSSEWARRIHYPRSKSSADCYRLGTLAAGKVQANVSAGRGGSCAVLNARAVCSFLGPHFSAAIHSTPNLVPQSRANPTNDCPPPPPTTTKRTQVAAFETFKRTSIASLPCGI